jgi:hypothetical protein
VCVSVYIYISLYIIWRVKSCVGWCAYVCIQYTRLLRDVVSCCRVVSAAASINQQPKNAKKKQKNGEGAKRRKHLNTREASDIQVSQ